MNADIALHFWYSTFLPMEYVTRLPWLSGPAIRQAGEATSLDISTHTGSRIYGDLGREATTAWLSYLEPTQADPNQVTTEFKEVM
jgi:hypothetical protein